MTMNSKWCALVLAAATLTAASCGNGGVRGFSPDSDYFMRAEIQDGTVNSAATDIRCTAFGSEPRLSFAISIDFTAVGGVGQLPGGTPLSAFNVDHYTVSYTNRTVPGGPVPAVLRVEVDHAVDVPGVVELDGWEIMQAGQKSQWPLNDPINLPNGAVEYTATITFYGHPVTDARDLISTSFQAQLFVFDTCADPDPITGCPPALYDPFDPSSFCS